LDKIAFGNFAGHHPNTPATRHFAEIAWQFRRVVFAGFSLLRALSGR